MTLAPAFEVQPEGGIECELCTLVLTFVEKEVGSNKTEASITKALEKVCSHLPGALGAGCKTLVDTYAAQIITAIINNEPPATACKNLKLCASSETSFEQPGAAPPAKVDGAIECFLCEKMMGLIIEEIGNNKTDAKIIKALENVCAKIPLGLAGPCKSIVDEYGPMILQSIASGADPKATSQKIKVCPNSASAFAATVARTVALREQRAERGRTQVIATFNTAGGRTLPCEACETAISGVQRALGNVKTVTAVAAELSRVCAGLPKRLGGECTKVVQSYFPEIVELVVHSIDAGAACKALRVCRAQKPAAAAAAPAQVAAPAISKTVECAACEILFGIAVNALDDKATLAQAIKVLDRVCGIVPPKAAAACDGVVALMGNKLAMYLIKKMPASKACRLAKACPATAVRSRIISK
jgi:saposin